MSLSLGSSRLVLALQFDQRFRPSAFRRLSDQGKLAEFLISSTGKYCFFQYVFRIHSSTSRNQARSFQPRTCRSRHPASIPSAIARGRPTLVESPWISLLRLTIYTYTHLSQFVCCYFAHWYSLLFRKTMCRVRMFTVEMRERTSASDQLTCCTPLCFVFVYSRVLPFFLKSLRHFYSNLQLPMIRQNTD